MNEEVLFGDFFEMDDPTVRVYRPVSDRKKLARVLEEYYMRMNYGNTQVSVLLQTLWCIKMLKNFFFLCITCI